MTEEEKKAAETAKAEEAKKADADFEASLDGLSEEEKTAKRDEKKASNTDNEIDYEAELEKEKSARKKAEDALAKKRFDAARNKEKEGEDPDADEEHPEDDKPLTAREARELLSQQHQETQRVVRAAEIENIAKALSRSDAEKALILEIHKNRQFPPHLSLQDQLEEAYVIANRKKIVGENSELKRALRNKDGVNRGGENAHRETAAPSGEPKLAPATVSMLKGSGYAWNAATKMHEKVLSNGDTIVRDPQTGKTTFRKKVK